MSYTRFFPHALGRRGDKTTWAYERRPKRGFRRWRRRRLADELTQEAEALNLYNDPGEAPCAS